jgi:hypothetical protein
MASKTNFLRGRTELLQENAGLNRSEGSSDPARLHGQSVQVEPGAVNIPAIQHDSQDHQK